MEEVTRLGLGHHCLFFTRNKQYLRDTKIKNKTLPLKCIWVWLRRTNYCRRDSQTHKKSCQKGLFVSNRLTVNAILKTLVLKPWETREVNEQECKQWKKPHTDSGHVQDIQACEFCNNNPNTSVKTWSVNWGLLLCLQIYKLYKSIWKLAYILDGNIQLIAFE